MGSRKLPEKVSSLYKAVLELFVEGADLNNLTVAEIAGKAGIGKGTVYEYFSNKEEVIAGALFYEVKSACQQMYEKLCQEKTLYDKINVILTSMEKKIAETNCIIHALHIMMDNSSISLRLRKMMEEKDPEDMLFMDLVRQVVADETTDTGDRQEGERTYLVMTVLSRIICFAMYQIDSGKTDRTDSRIIRERICRDVCRDVEDFRAEKQSN